MFAIFDDNDIKAQAECMPSGVTQAWEQVSGPALPVSDINNYIVSGV